MFKTLSLNQVLKMKENEMKQYHPLTRMFINRIKNKQTWNRKEQAMYEGEINLIIANEYIIHEMHLPQEAYNELLLKDWLMMNLGHKQAKELVKDKMEFIKNLNDNVKEYYGIKRKELN